MDGSRIARRVMKLALPHVARPEPFFEIMWREIMYARERGWLGDERAALLAAMIAEQSRSPAQLFQDAWVLFETGHKRDGFFAEFGATDGRDLSNTYLLETEFGWKGILSEPNPGWHAALRRNRPHAAIATECVWSSTGETLPFLATSEKEFGTIETFAEVDRHAKARASHTRINVPSISLNDLLVRYEAPRDIDFISIDTEGSEYQILEPFDFDRWNVALFSIEHNFTESEGRIVALLESKGYERRFPDFSRYDAWFRKRRL
jgi:FkbM family methyltransferase